MARPPAGADPRAVLSVHSEPTAGHMSRATSIEPEVEATASVGGVTPSMAQFLEIKAANPDCILWYRMGDFYELFFQDAVVVAEALSITLTKRGKHLGNDIPMCGVPVVRADEYLQRLIRKGFRVAVCEQLEDPAEARKRGSKSIVRRDVVRLVTPGTLTEETLLDAKARNYLTALFRVQTGKGEAAPPIALASLDISTGEFEVGEVAESDLAGELVRLAPGEVLATDDSLADTVVAGWIKHAGAAATPIAPASYDAMAGERLLKAQLGVSDLAGFGAFSRSELAAVGAVLKYVELTQLGKKPMLRPPRKSGPSAVLVIDAATRTNLELLRSTSGEKSGSLLGAMDRTVTGAGARELAGRLASPLRDLAMITARLDAVGYLCCEDQLREDIRAAMRRAPDLARAMSRLAFQRGGPRDLGAVRDALHAANSAAELLADKVKVIGVPLDLQAIMTRLQPRDLDLLQRLDAALIDEPPPFRRDGGFIRSGFSADIDQARRLREDSRQVMAALEAKYIALTGVKTLKVRHNNILGYFIELTANTAKPLLSEPLSATFKHRQTMVSAVRFTSDELTEIEGRIATAGERALGLEQDVFNALADAISSASLALTGLAAALAELDCTAGLSELAREQSYVRPVLDGGSAFEVRGGRHPVVEQALKAERRGPFIENDCVLGGASGAPLDGFEDTAEGRIWLVTGPNMAGKSTFLRQNALIAVLAQMGSYVPARSANIGLIDRLFSRVGASDDLARGRSTFMVEMVETAGILNQATPQSLVILDEIGRGTATFDGLAIAWATVEFLHEMVRCRTLFATHYHEMTALSAKLPEISNVTIDVKEWQDDIVFLHKLKPGAADRSYGIQVAKLAGLPAPVIRRAGDVLRLLEKSDSKSASVAALDDLPLFAAARPQGFTGERMAASVVEAALAKINPDDLTPKAALDALYTLKNLMPKAKS
jgi:DNA mismatch repair protein MutS